MATTTRWSGEGFHGTTEARSASILASGFRTGPPDNPCWGEGTFFAFNEDAARVYGQTVVRAELTLAAALIGHGFGELVSLLGRAEWRARCQQDGDLHGLDSGIALNQMARDHGVDGFVITGDEPDDGGPQIVVFHPGRSILRPQLITEDTRSAKLLAGVGD